MNRTQHLTDDAYEDLVHDFGYRLALLVLRAQAVQGNIKALELYIKVVNATRASRVKPGPAAVSADENNAFVRRAKVSDAGQD